QLADRVTAPEAARDGFRRAFGRRQTGARPPRHEPAQVFQPGMEEQVDEMIEFDEQKRRTLHEQRGDAVRHRPNLVDVGEFALEAIPERLDDHRAEGRLELLSFAIEKRIVEANEGIPGIELAAMLDVEAGFAIPVARGRKGELVGAGAAELDANPLLDGRKR